MSGKRRTWHTGITRLSAVSSKAYTGVILSSSITTVEFVCEFILVMLDPEWLGFVLLILFSLQM